MEFKKYNTFSKHIFSESIIHEYRVWNPNLGFEIYNSVFEIYNKGFEMYNKGFVMYNKGFDIYNAVFERYKLQYSY